MKRFGGVMRILAGFGTCRGLRAWLFRAGPYVLVGLGIGWIVLNINAGPGVISIPKGEAEGPEYADPDHLDLVSNVHRSRACPALTQRYVSRPIIYNGQKATQIIPLTSTVAPFLGDDGVLVLTISSDEVPDRDSGDWKYRTVTVETCPWLPQWGVPFSWLTSLFGPRLSRSADEPVNFRGTPHEP